MGAHLRRRNNFVSAKDGHANTARRDSVASAAGKRPPASVDGRLYEPTHTDFGDELFREIDESVRILTADGAHVLFLTLPARARTSELAKGSESNAEASALVNDIMTTYSFGHPESTSVVDLATLVCPTIYPCEQVIDGVALRPRDGGHFGNEGAKWVAPRLFDLDRKSSHDRSLATVSNSRAPRAPRSIQ